MRASIALLFLFLGACAAGPWAIREYVSAFDGATETKIGPVYIDEDLGIYLFRRSTAPEDHAVLTVFIAELRSFESDPAVRFKIDGEVVPLDSIDPLTLYRTEPGYSGSGIYLAPTQWSEKRYSVDRAFLRRILSARDVVVRVDLDNGRYVEGVFAPENSQFAARVIARKFYAHLWGDADLPPIATASTAAPRAAGARR